VDPMSLGGKVPEYTKKPRTLKMAVADLMNRYDLKSVTVENSEGTSVTFRLGDR